MTITIYVVENENVALLIGNVFIFVLEIHRLFVHVHYLNYQNRKMNLNLLFGYRNYPYTFIW